MKKTLKGEKKVQSNTIKSYFHSKRGTTKSVVEDGAAGGEPDLKQTNTADSSNVDSASDQTGVG